MLQACLFGHGQQGVDGQQPQPGPQGQALGDGAGGAQAGERARTTAEGNGVQLVIAQAQGLHALLDGGNQRGRRLCAARTLVLPDALAMLDGDGQLVRAGIKGKQFHGGATFEGAVCHTTNKGSAARATMDYRARALSQGQAWPWHLPSPVLSGSVRRH